LGRIVDATEDQVEIEMSKASSIVQVAEIMIRTAEVENSFIALTKGNGSGFIPTVKPVLPNLQTSLPPANGVKKNLTNHQMPADLVEMPDEF
jgi:hypothetical protein